MEGGLISAVSPFVAAIFGVLSSLATGIAVGAWYASAKNEKLKQNTDAIKAINDRCEQQRATMLLDLEKSICSGIKAALVGLENTWLLRNTETQTTIARIDATVKQHDDDIREIFVKIDNEARKE